MAINLFDALSQLIGSDMVIIFFIFCVIIQIATNIAIIIYIKEQMTKLKTKELKK